MTLIKFDSLNISNIQEKLKKENNELLNEIENFNKELYEVKAILNTPKSSVIIPEQIEILKEMEAYIRKQDVYFDHIFSVAKNEYDDFYQKIKSMVGDVDE